MVKLVSDERTRYRIMFGTQVDRDGVNLGPIAEHDPEIHRIARSLGAYSITRTLGYWEGVEEPGYVIEHIGTSPLAVEWAARLLAEYLNQAEVWITSEPVSLTRVVR